MKELPDKIESEQTYELLPEQKRLYIAYLAQLQHEALKHLIDEVIQPGQEAISSLTEDEIREILMI